MPTTTTAAPPMPARRGGPAFEERDKDCRFRPCLSFNLTRFAGACYTGRMAYKLQFSLRWMLAAVAVAALITAEASAFPHSIALAIGIVLSVILPAALVAAIVYARGSVQAFCIGASVALLAASTDMLSTSGFNLPTSGCPLSIAFLSTIPSSFLSRLGSSVGVEFSLRWIIAIAGGFMAVVVRWMAGGGGNAQPRSGERV